MITIPTHIKALIFDLDGTLADTMPIHLKSWVQTGKELGVNITKELINAHLGTPTVALVQLFNNEFSWDLDPQEVRKVKQKYFNAIKEAQGKIQPIEKIYQVAKDMKGKMPMSVGTGSSRGNALKSLEDLGASDWWVTIITGSDDVPGKPSPEIFLECAKAMNVNPEECLVFEDGPSGIQAAISAKMEYINVNEL